MPLIQAPGGGSSANLNLSNTHESIGFNADGTMTQAQSNASTNLKGTYVSLGTPSNNWSGFYLFIGNSSGSTSRMSVDVRLGGSTVIVPDLYVEPNNAVGPYCVFIPLAVTAAALDVRVQAATGNQTVRVAIVGVVSNSQSAPMFTTMENITSVDLTNTRAGTVDMTLQASGSTTFTQFTASTSQTYGAVLVQLGHNGSTPAVSQAAKFSLATGAAASETVITDWPIWVTNTGAPMSSQKTFPLINKSIASGTRLSGRVIAATPGTDAVRFAVYGFR